MSDGIAYNKYRSETCEWCARHLSGDPKVTNVLPQSAPDFVHKVYPPHVAGPLSEYLPCKSKPRGQWEDEQTERADTAEKALAEVREKLAEETERAEVNWNALERIKGKWEADRAVLAERERIMVDQTRVIAEYANILAAAPSADELDWIVLHFSDPLFWPEHPHNLWAAKLRAFATKLREG